jgi:hypothetical protein
MFEHLRRLRRTRTAVRVALSAADAAFDSASHTSRPHRKSTAFSID